MSNKTAEQYETENKELRAKLDIAKKKIETGKFTKDFSDYFRNKESDTAKVYKNLSETAKHVESKQSEILDEMKRRNDNKLLTVTQFNANVAKALSEMYA